MSHFQSFRARAVAALVLLAAIGCGTRARREAAAAQPSAQASAQASGVSAPATQVAAGPEVTIYKSPTCGCCHIWMNQMQEAGFKMVVRDTADVQKVNDGLRIPAKLTACHTSVIDGVPVVGHVPPEVIRQFLAERPAGAVGIAVAGMPSGAMAGGGGEPFDVLVFDAAGNTRVYATR